MSLDAFVYRNCKNLPAHLREKVATDPGSGALYFRNAADYKLYPLSELEACDEHIGNIALVAFIREEIAQAFGHQDSLLSTKVVYNGTHAGDSIPFFEIDQLSREIDELEKMTTSSQSAELAKFIEQMRNLIVAAIREGNGIVF
jgi:hypothetical protein